MIELRVLCPECEKVGFLKVDENIVEKSLRGITAIEVPELLLCDHSFMVYIDKNYAIRDSFITDFKIKLPQIIMDQKPVDPVDNQLIEIDPYFIIINLSALTLTRIIHCLLFRKKIAFFHDLDILGEHLIKLLQYIFNGAFEIDFTFKNIESYKKNKRDLKNHIIFLESKVLNDKTKVLYNKKMNIERSIIQEFLASMDPMTNLIIFKNEIQKIYLLSQEIIELNKIYSKKGELTNKIITDHFIETRQIKIQREYIEFLCEIIKSYFGIELNRPSDVSNLLGY